MELSLRRLPASLILTLVDKESFNKALSSPWSLEGKVNLCDTTYL
jgi:hypothetical protein